MRDISGRWPAWLLLLCTTLATPFLVFPNRNTSVALLILLLSALLALVRGFYRRTPLDLPLLFFFVAIAASALLALQPSLGQAKLAGIVLGAAVLLSFTIVEPTEQNIRRVSWLLLAAGGAMALAGILGTGWATYKLGLPVAVYSRLPKLDGTALWSLPDGFHPNEVGGTLALFLPLGLALSMRRVALPLRVAAIILTILYAIVLVLTQSRSALFGTAIACLLVVAVANRWLRYAMLVAGLGVIGWLASQGVDGLKQFLLAFDQASSYVGSVNFALRLEIWQRALYIVRDFPFTGIGLGTFPALALSRYPFFIAEAPLGYGHAHNIFLETAIDFGIGGLLALLLLLATLGLMLWRTWTAATGEMTRAMVLGVGGGMAGHFLFGLTDAVNWGAKPGVFVWAYLGASVLIWASAGRPRILPRIVWGDASVAPNRWTERPILGKLAVGVAGLALLGAFVLLRQPLVGAFENNMAARDLGRLALAQVDWKSQVVRKVGPESRLLLAERYQRVIDRLEGVVRRDPDNVAAQRNLANAYATRGDFAAAVPALLRVIEREPGNLLARLELAQAYSSLGETGLSLPIYRSLISRFPEVHTLKDAEVDDYVFHHLNAGVERLAAGESDAALVELRKALEGRPGDLFASAYLARAFATAGQEKEAADARAKLHNFTLGTDARVYERYLPDLLLPENGFLHSGELDRIASFLLWQGIVEPAVPVLDLLAQERPLEKLTWLLRSEMHIRQGQLTAAIADLERVLALDPRDVDANVRLGQLLEREQPESALAAYRRSLALAPTHLSALRGAVALLEDQGRAEEAREMRQKIASLSNDGAEVAAKMGLPQGEIRLEAEPPFNSELLIGLRHPVGWRWETWLGGKDYGDAFYAGGVDERESNLGERSMRISALWAERRPQSGSYWLDRNERKQLARAGYFGPRIAIDGDSLYALAFSYKTANWRTGNAQAMLYVQDLEDGPNELLPDTGGRWKRRSILVANRRPELAMVRPLFTSSGVGDVWFADIRLYKVVPRSGIPVQPANVAEIK